MKKYLLVLFLVTCNSAFAQSSVSTLLESDKWNDAELDHGTLSAIQTVIQTAGYRCDSFTRTGSHIGFGRNGYWVRCNHDSYKYILEDRGGRLSVELK
jgi:hypothetical protein